MASRSVARQWNEAFPASPPLTPRGRSSPPWRSPTPSIQFNHFRSTVVPEQVTDAECGGAPTTWPEGLGFGAGYALDRNNRGLAGVREPGDFGRAHHGRRRPAHRERSVSGAVALAARAVLQHRDQISRVVRSASSPAVLRLSRAPGRFGPDVPRQTVWSWQRLARSAS